MAWSVYCALWMIFTTSIVNKNMQNVQSELELQLSALDEVDNVQSSGYML